MCDVSENIRLHMMVDPYGQFVSFAAGSDAKKKTRKEKQLREL